MKHVSILVPKGHTSLVNIGGTHQMLTWVNEFFEQTDRQALFDIHLVGTVSDVLPIGSSQTSSG